MRTIVAAAAASFTTPPITLTTGLAVWMLTLFLGWIIYKAVKSPRAYARDAFLSLAFMFLGVQLAGGPPNLGFLSLWFQALGGAVIALVQAALPVAGH